MSTESMQHTKKKSENKITDVEMWDLIQENLYFVWYEYKNIKEAVV